MKNTKLVWRLSTRPTVDEVLKLVEKKLLTNEEAKGVIFSSETEETKNIESLEAEVKFLKDLVEQMARTRTSVVESIQYIERPRKNWPWFEENITWCSSLGGNTSGSMPGATLVRL